MFGIGSSAIDWCEPNYKYTGYVAELYNTISNVPLIVLPLIGLYLHNPYFKYVNSSVRWVYWFAIAVGVASVYYHATLSLVGQLLDELSLLWVTIVGYCVWMPSMRFAKSIKRYAAQLVAALLGIAIIGSFLVFLEPSINAYLLMTMILPIMLCMGTEVKLANNATANGFSLFLMGSWSTAISIWLSDRFMCGFWQNVGFPYLHACWHVLSGVSAYIVIVLFSYLDASAVAPELSPRIAYFPAKCPIGLPYVRLNAVY